MKNELKQISLVGITLILVFVVLLISLTDFGKTPDTNKDDLKNFDSYQELESFLETSVENSESYGSNFAGSFGVSRFEEDSILGANNDNVPSVESASDSAKSSSQGQDYSTTNIQVAGVDEPDFVKNDGKYVYVAKGNELIIIDAFPAEEMKIVSEIELEGGEYAENIFINGDKLIVFVPVFKYYDSGIGCGRESYVFGKPLIMPCSGYSKQYVKVLIYDISEKENPELEEQLKVTGYFVNARMIGDYVYLISSNYVQLDNFEPPVLEANGVEREIPVSDVYYFDNYERSYNLNLISAININSGEFNTQTYLMGASSNIYVSENNIYLSYMKNLKQDYLFEKYVAEVLVPSLPDNIASEVKEISEEDSSFDKKTKEIRDIFNEHFESLDDEEKTALLKLLDEKMESYYEAISREMQKTVIHKIKIDELEISHEGNGEVPGVLLNQFSMDENEGNLRVATTTGNNWFSNQESENNLYVLNEDLKITGKLEGLAKGERIYSVRYMQDRAYMVTFRQVDPLFVIDLSDSTDPKVLGFLKVTGFSNYLHPYDENHIIGIGQEASEEGRAQGVKIALFDVTDVANPTEKSKFVVEEGLWSSTDVSYDHKAFLFDKEKELMVLPISYTKESRERTQQDGRFYPYYEYWQGAFVFDIDLENGINLKGRIEHDSNRSGDYWYGGSGYVRRSLYIDDYLYTISDLKVKANFLANLGDVKEVEIAQKTDYPFGVYATDVGVVSSAEPEAVQKTNAG